MAPRANPSPPAPPVLPLQFDTYQPMPESDEWAQNYVTPMMLQVPAMLGTDMDNTPRVPDFPQNVMGTGPPVHDHPVEYSAPEPQPQPQHIMPFTDPFDLSADLDLEAYNIGLHHYNVAAGAGPGFAEASRYGMPPSSYDVDYSTIFHGGGGTQE
ncbi:hypothetical protein C2E23DRAFT_881123 [Lenzites betulinus]|nr:hypothetical protein C2E23DRAFT_881123 [Lenzites betulinus]